MADKSHNEKSADGRGYYDDKNPNCPAKLGEKSEPEKEYSSFERFKERVPKLSKRRSATLKRGF